MSYQIISQIHLLPPHQRDFFAGAPVTRMIGQYNIVELGQITVSEELLKALSGLLRRLLSRGEILILDEAGKRFDLESLFCPVEAEKPAPEPEASKEPEKAPEDAQTAPEPEDSTEEGETQPDAENGKEEPSRTPRRKKKRGRK